MHCAHSWGVNPDPSVSTNRTHIGGNPGIILGAIRELSFFAIMKRASCVTVTQAGACSWPSWLPSSSRVVPTHPLLSDLNCESCTVARIWARI